LIEKLKVSVLVKTVVLDTNSIRSRNLGGKKYIIHAHLTLSDAHKSLCFYLWWSLFAQRDKLYTFLF
jgi:hypothetical protein